MPLYDYRCRACSTVTEVRHGFREAYDGTCPNCGGALARVFNPAGIVFKGSGFYINDSRKSSGSDGAAASTSAASDAKPAAGGDAKPSGASESKPAASSPPSSGDGGSKKSESSAA